MTPQQHSHRTFFSIDLTAGSFRWWFGIIILMISTLSMVLLNAGHHVSLGIIFLVTIALSCVVQPRAVSNQDYGLIWDNLPKLILWTLIAFAVFAGLVYWFEHSSTNAMKASKQVMESLKFGESYSRDLMLILTICVFAPLNEELIYRGVIFRGVWNSLLKQQRLNFGSETSKKWFSFVIATAMSGFLFMSAHGGDGGGQDTQIYMILLLGVIACGLYALTGSLIAPIMFHCLNNSFAVWQSLDAGHMTFTRQAGSMPLETVMFASPALALLVVLSLWMMVRVFSKVNPKRHP